MVTTGDNLSTIVDAKHILWDTLYKAYDEINKKYPTLCNVKVEKGYPSHGQVLQRNKPTDPPKVYVSIVLSSNNEDLIAIGDTQQTGVNSVDNTYDKDLSNFQSEIYEISTWALENETRDKFGLVTRQILFNQKQMLHNKYDFKIIRLVSGRDEEVDSRQDKLPLTIYRRIYSLMITNRINKYIIDDLVEGLTVNEIIDNKIVSSITRVMS